VKLLLDTHVALWAIAADTRLPQPAQLLVADPSNDIFLSAASIWEITIKYALNRGRPNDMPVSGPQALAYFKAAGYGFLSVTGEHAVAVSRLPDLHRDPFDRIIVAQALYEPLRLITHDAQVGAYSDSIGLV
jgi:PIN domain nuclease of toxin-antitoxin system